jgi:hypothetical protein
VGQRPRILLGVGAEQARNRRRDLIGRGRDHLLRRGRLLRGHTDLGTDPRQLPRRCLHQIRGDEHERHQPAPNRSAPKEEAEITALRR